MDPEISYVMPVRNGETTIASSIYSIREADHEHWDKTEVVIVNDGSDDATQAILDSLKGDMPQLSVYQMPPKGKGFSRNFGNSQAKADIIAVLDADDWNLPGRTAMILKTFKRYPKAGAFYSSFVTYHTDNGERGRMDAQQIDPKHLRETGEFKIGHSTMAYRKDVALKHPYSESPRHDDWWFQWQLWTHDVGFCWSDSFLMEYRITHLTKEKENDAELTKRILEKKKAIMEPYFKEKASGRTPEKVAS